MGLVVQKAEVGGVGGWEVGGRGGSLPPLASFAAFSAFRRRAVADFCALPPPMVADSDFSDPHRDAIPLAESALAKPSNLSDRPCARAMPCGCLS